MIEKNTKYNIGFINLLTSSSQEDLKDVLVKYKLLGYTEEESTINCGIGLKKLYENVTVCVSFTNIIHVNIYIHTYKIHKNSSNFKIHRKCTYLHCEVLACSYPNL